MTSLCLGLKENFPFSHFPMYRSFSDYTYVVYVTDREGDPIAMETITATRAGKLKKIYNKELDKERKRRKAADPTFTTSEFTGPELAPAGQHALEWFIENCKTNGLAELETHRPLRLYHCGITRSGGDFHHAHFLVYQEPGSSTGEPRP